MVTEVTLGVSDLTLFWLQPPLLVPLRCLSILLNNEQVSTLWGTFGTYIDTFIHVLQRAQRPKATVRSNDDGDKFDLANS